MTCLQATALAILSIMAGIPIGILLKIWADKEDV